MAINTNKNEDENLVQNTIDSKIREVLWWRKIFKISKIIIIDFVISFVIFLIVITQFSKFVKKEIILKIMVYRGTAHMQPGEELGVETVTIMFGIIFPFIFFIVLVFSGIKHYLRYKKLNVSPQ